LNYKNTRTPVVFVLRFASIIRRPQLIRYLVTSELLCTDCSVTHSPRSLHYDVSCDVSLPGMRSGQVWRHGRRTVRGHPRSPHFSMDIISVTVQLRI